MLVLVVPMVVKDIDKDRRRLNTLIQCLLALLIIDSSAVNRHFTFSSFLLSFPFFFFL